MNRFFSQYQKSQHESESYWKLTFFLRLFHQTAAKAQNMVEESPTRR